MDYTNADDVDFGTRMNHLVELEQYLGFPFCKSENNENVHCQVGIGSLACPCPSSLLRNHSNSSSPSEIPYYQNPLALNVIQLVPSPNLFLYTLVAPTSAASRITDECITFLNQGQSYELKLKKLHNSYSPQILESVIRLTFHERRLQFAEKEQFDNWAKNRKDEKMIEFDVPLLYNVIKPDSDLNLPNAVSVRWLGQEEASIGLKLNCISTEFTAKKHGGEKGVPLRMQVETYALEENHEDSKTKRTKLSHRLLHSAYCLVKIFKPNGADRKNKNDLSKISKMTSEEKSTYQSSFETTVFTDISLDHVSIPCHELLREKDLLNSRTFIGDSKKQLPLQKNANNIEELLEQYMQGKQGECDNPTRPSESFKVKRSNMYFQEKCIASSFDSHISHDPLQISPCKAPYLMQSFSGEPEEYFFPLTINSSSVEITKWLKQNNFDDFVNLLQNFSGADLFRLTRNDLVQICGLADGIRLYNAIYSKKFYPRLTLFVQIRTDMETCVALSKTLSTDSLESISPTGVSSTVTTATLIKMTSSNQMTSSFNQPIELNGAALATPILCKSLKNAHSLPELKPGRCRPSDESSSSSEAKRIKLSTNIMSHPELTAYHPVYMDMANLQQLSDRLARICRLQPSHILKIFHRDKAGFTVIVTDDFVENIENRSCLTVDVVTDSQTNPGFNIFLHTMD